MLGCGLKPNTSMHGVEELAEPPYLFSGEEIVYQMTDAQGRCFPLSCKRHGFAGTLQRYDRLENILTPAALKQGFVMQATCYIIDSAQMWEKAEKQLIENPLYFVDRE